MQRVCVCCSEGQGSVTVFSIKVMLAILCGGKIVDKLRCEYFLHINHNTVPKATAPPSAQYEQLLTLLQNLFQHPAKQGKN